MGIICSKEITTTTITTTAATSTTTNNKVNANSDPGPVIQIQIEETRLVYVNSGLGLVIKS